MEKSFVGFGPGSSALPVRSQDGVQSLIRRGRGRAAPVPRPPTVMPPTPRNHRPASAKAPAASTEISISPRIRSRFVPSASRRFASAAVSRPSKRATLHGPTHFSSGTCAMSFAPATKCFGASMCVPLWLPSVSTVRLHGHVCEIVRNGVLAGAGSPGNTAAENSSLERS